MNKRIVIVKVFAVDEKGNPIEYLAYEVPAPRKLLTDRLHHLLISLHWRARISTPSGTRGAVDVRRRPPVRWLHPDRGSHHESLKASQTPAPKAHFTDCLQERPGSFA